MSDQTSTPGRGDEVLAEFLKAYDEASDASAVLAEFCSRHAALAGEFQSLASANRLLERSGRQTEPEPPKVLGEFQIVRSIARGGMGEIYEAYHARLQRKVAVKIIRQGRTSPISRERFLREQRVLAQLHQTHIVPIHTAGEEGDIQYFAMPYIEGAALSHVVKSARAFESSNPKSGTPSLARLAGMAVSCDRTKENEQGPGGAAKAAASTEPYAKSTASRLGRTRESGDPALDARAEDLNRPHLSLEYFRSVAQVMADAAEAIHHAHGQSILHRDVKPSNIMVDSAGQCWIIDFGLAAWLNGESKRMQADECPNGGDGLTVSGLLGTPQYMAPEQCAGKADARTDVWGLGVTLYELLTLQRAFDGPTEQSIRDKILLREPIGADLVVPSVPLDLAAIYRKALEKDAALRYLSAGDLASDLRRWLRHEPTMARPAHTLRRLGLWSRRNKGWAAAMAGAVLSIVALSGAGIFIAEGRTIAVKHELAAAEERERLLERESLIQKIIALRMGNHWTGWSTEARHLAWQAAKIKRDENLRDQYAATLAGIDAKELPGQPTPASAVVFSKDGKRLLIGGHTDFQGIAREPARVWEGGLDEPRKSKQFGSGPVAFRATDGAALHFVPDPLDWFTVRLWNIDTQELVREFKLSDRPSPPNWYQSHSITLALCPDGTQVAASLVSLVGGHGKVMVWDVHSGKEIRRGEKGFSALAFTPDGRLLAGGTRDGQVMILAGEETRERVTFPAGKTAILALAFSRDTHRTHVNEPQDTWILADGDAGGSVTIWDLKTKSPRMSCRGSAHSTHAMAFSPDGAVLVSAGRYDARLWDAASGQLILILKGSIQRNWFTSVSYSQDGSRLAVSSATAFGVLGGVDVWKLEHGRGIQTLRGLGNRAAQVIISPDDRLLAALDDDWRVGIWELSSGRLIHVLEAPAGYFNDNAALAFSPNGARIALASGSTTTLWNTETGDQIHSWILPPGMSDHMAFDPTGKRLLLVRVETDRGELPPLDRVPWQEHPRVARAYDLLSLTPLKAFLEFKDCKRHIVVGAISPDASYFVLRGMPEPADPLRRVIKVLDSASGLRELQSFYENVLTPDFDSGTTTDPTGRMLVLEIAQGTKLTRTAFEMPAGKLIGTLGDYGLPGVGGRLWLQSSALYHDLNGQPLFGLDPDAKRSNGPSAAFNVKGTHLALANRDGTVSVFDLEETQRSLASLGLAK